VRITQPQDHLDHGYDPQGDPNPQTMALHQVAQYALDGDQRAWAVWAEACRALKGVPTVKASAMLDRCWKAHTEAEPVPEPEPVDSEPVALIHGSLWERCRRAGVTELGLALGRESGVVAPEVVSLWRFPVTAQAAYVQAVIDGWSAADLAALAVEPVQPAGGSKKYSLKILNEWVETYCPHLLDGWQAKLAAAADPKNRKPGWPVDWSLPLAELILPRPVPRSRPAAATAEIEQLEEALAD
jgi:hypothetical protein